MEETVSTRDAVARRSLATRLVALVVAIVVLTGIGASFAWAKTRPAPVGTGVVVVETSLIDGRGAGAGMVLTSAGEVLTNNHVIRGATSIRIVLPGTGRSYEAKVLGYSVSKDVAVIKANGASILQDGLVRQLGDAPGRTDGEGHRQRRWRRHAHHLDGPCHRARADDHCRRRRGQPAPDRLDRGEQRARAGRLGRTTSSTPCTRWSA